MTKLSIMDLAFFLTETEDSPKHVGGMMMFRKPAKTGADFVEKAVLEYVGSNEDIRAPFNQVIKFGGLSTPRWVDACDFNIDDHIYYHQLEGDDFRDELYVLIGELHSTKMDREKPMWEVHLIEGIDDQRFALYIKLHHAYADGITMSAILAKSLSQSSRARKVAPIWSALPNRRRRRKDEDALLRRMLGLSGNYLRSVLGLTKLSTQLALEAVNLTKNAVAVPYKPMPETPLNGHVVAGRQVATAAVPMTRVNKIRKQTRSTLNHVALTCIDGALHRYLEECGADISEPITIQMPVNLRRPGDRSMGNKIGIVLVELAKKTTDPYERLREIGFTLRNVRYQVDGVPPASVIAYTVLLGSFAQLTEFLKIDDRLPPLGNTLVSNVPGPSKPLYLRGAKLEEMYPISALTPGCHLNITLYSYDGRLQFGLVASSALPKLEILSDYIHDAFAELDDAVSPTALAN